ncbi:MAG TPA: gamma carbonic anhydrase family protein [Rhodospirillaceae bacterium]|nr:gamma carbonic anhydrase family protein [Rhodospirillaceae bacterium]
MTGLIFPYKSILPKISETAFVAANAVICGDVVIGAGSGVWFNCVVRGDVHHIRIGERTNIQDGTIVHVTRDRFACLIGSNVTVGHAAILHGCTLEDDCFVGMGATVMDGAVVESGGMVAAGALVTPGKVVKKGTLWAGSPAKYLRPLTEQELAFFPVSAAGYAELAAEYLANQKKM